MWLVYHEGHIAVETDDVSEGGKAHRDNGSREGGGMQTVHVARVCSFASGTVAEELARDLRLWGGTWRHRVGQVSRGWGQASRVVGVAVRVLTHTWVTREDGTNSCFRAPLAAASRIHSWGPGRDGFPWEVVVRVLVANVMGRNGRGGQIPAAFGKDSPRVC